MAIPPSALELENRSVGPNGEPTLWPAYEVLRAAWNAGGRDRELGLHLMFLAWYQLVEPPHLTGLPNEAVCGPGLVETFNEVHDFFALRLSSDAEMLYVVGLMALLAPYLLGEESEWTRRSEAYRVQYRRLAPAGIDPEVFAARGAYGDYFAGQARVVGGY